ncbi:unnamed protein product [Symbiodinium sp. CCMP2456]|nr:unnamed protein product [Symbiodinium sp. CCMP2456]
MLYKIASAGRAKTNVCRNLHRLIHREGVTLPLEISLVQVPVRKRRPCVKKVMVWYPCIYPSTWMSYMLENQSYLVLGGVDIQEPSKWQGILNDFWQQYLLYDEQHTYTTRFLFTVVPSELYWKDATLDGLNRLQLVQIDIVAPALDQAKVMSLKTGEEQVSDPESAWAFRCGKDFVSSGLVLLCKLELVPGRGLPTRLADAYSDFVQWCSRHGKSTSIRGFSKAGFKMGYPESI